MHSCAPQIATYLKIIVGAFQILSKLSLVFHIVYPKMFRVWLLKHLHILSFDVLGPTHMECFVPAMGGLKFRFIFTMIMPPVALLVIMLFRMAGQARVNQRCIMPNAKSKSLLEGMESALVDKLTSQSAATAALESIDTLDSGIILSGMLEMAVQAQIVSRWCIVRPTRIEVFEEQAGGPSFDDNPAEALILAANDDQENLRIVRIPLQGIQTRIPTQHHTGLPPFQLRLTAVATTSNNVMIHAADNTLDWKDICIGFNSDALLQTWNAALLCDSTKELDASPTLPMMIQLMLPVAFILYPTLVNVAFQMLSCRSLGEAYLGPSESVNRFDYSVDCTSPAYQKYKYGSVVCLLFYALGMPTCFASILWRHRSDLGRDAAHDTNSSRATKAQLGFLVESYKPKYFMFEILEYLRKLILTGALSVVGVPGSAIQSFVGVVVSFGFFALTSAWLPFAKESVGPAPNKHLVLL